jgi:hypothetical protein
MKVKAANPMGNRIIYKNEGEVLLALRDHFNPKEYVVLPQVRNGAGFDATRTADALVMGTWPSRGLGLFGIEIKVSRFDWFREKNDPRKAEEIATFCDYWVLAVGDDEIVKDGELPEMWGLMVPGKNPATIRMKVPPKKLEPKPLSRSFLACILRRTLETVVPLANIDAEIERRVAVAVAIECEEYKRKLAIDFDPAVLISRNAELEAAAKAFYDASGIWLYHSNAADMKKLGEAYALLRYHGLTDWLANAEKDMSVIGENLHTLRKSIPTNEEKVVRDAGQ